MKKLIAVMALSTMSVSAFAVDNSLCYQFINNEMGSAVAIDELAKAGQTEVRFDSAANILGVDADSYSGYVDAPMMVGVNSERRIKKEKRVSREKLLPKIIKSREAGMITKQELTLKVKDRKDKDYKGNKRIRYILRSDEQNGRLVSVTKKRGFLLTDTEYKVNFKYNEAGECYPSTGHRDVKVGKKTRRKEFNTDLCQDLAKYYNSNRKVFSCLKDIYETSRSEDGIGVESAKNPMSDIFDILAKHKPMFSGLTKAQAEMTYQLPVMSMKEIYSCVDFGLLDFDEQTGTANEDSEAYINRNLDGDITFKKPFSNKTRGFKDKAFGI